MREFKRFVIMTSVGSIELTKGTYLSLLGKTQKNNNKKTIKKNKGRLPQKD